MSGKAGKADRSGGGTAKGKGKAAKAMRKSAKTASKPAMVAMRSKRHRGRKSMMAS